MTHWRSSSGFCMGPAEFLEQTLEQHLGGMFVHHERALACKTCLSHDFVTAALSIFVAMVWCQDLYEVLSEDLR